MQKKRLRFGVVQGRLIKSPPGQLQWFPQDCWESEFFLASAMNIDYIELIAERIHNTRNPIWTEAGVFQLKELARQNDISMHAFCNDYIIDHSLVSCDDVLSQNLKLIEQGAILGCEKYILPLFEQSELTVDNVDQFVVPVRIIADHASKFGLTVCLETLLSGVELIEAVHAINHPSVKVVFDTGNRVAFGHDLPGDIQLLGNLISHVHIKDKNARNENVILGTGLVNFLEVFKALDNIQYEGPYTFETNRGKNPIRTMKFNIEMIKFFYEESLGL